jgi:hypothetical protein
MTAEEFNDWYQVGHPVIVVKDDGTEFQTNTRSAAWTIGNGRAVIKISGITGGYDLARIRPMEVHAEASSALRSPN